MVPAITAGWSGLANDQALAPALASLAETVAALLGPLPTTTGQGARIHDPVWGPITLSAPEMTLLDTSLFQRLRNIRQLGGVHLVFPGAQHSRFEHSIGVLAQTTRMCAAIQRTTPVPKDTVANLRLAALSHDLGHGPFSHCSERLLATLDPIPAISNLLPDIGAAEALSWLIMSSAPMRRFVERLNKLHGCELDCTFAAAAITGTMTADQAFLGDIIHGPMDADKIDYLKRDALFCGLAIDLDTERLFASIDTAHCPDRQGRLARRMVFNSNALAALSKVVQYKSQMRNVVYHHQAGRSFAALLNAALGLVGRAADRPETIFRLKSAGDLLKLSDPDLLAPNGLATTASAQLLLERLRGRKLYKRAAMVSADAQAMTILSKRAHEFEQLISTAAGLTTEPVVISPAIPPWGAEIRDLHILVNAQPEPIGSKLSHLEWSQATPADLDCLLIFAPAAMIGQVKTAATAVLNSEFCSSALTITPAKA